MSITLWMTLSRTLDILLLLFVAIILAEGVRPIVDWLHDHHVPRALAVLLLYLVGGALLVLLGWWFVQPLLGEAASLIDHLPQYERQATDLIEQMQRTIHGSGPLSSAVDALRGQVKGMAGHVVSPLIHAPLTVATVGFKLLEVLFMAFFWLTAIRGLKPYLVGLLPEGTQDDAADILSEMGRRLGGYVRGVAVDMVVVGVVTGFVLWLLGVPYALLLGVVAGLVEALPLVGTFVGQAVAIVVALIAVGPLKAGEVWLATMVIQQAEGNVLIPLVMNRAVDLNPLTVTLAILLGGTLFGILGAIVAVPAAVVIKVLVVRVLAPAAHRAMEAAGSGSQ